MSPNRWNLAALVAVGIAGALAILADVASVAGLLGVTFGLQLGRTINRIGR